MLGLNPIVTGTLAGAMLAPIWPQSALFGLGIGMVSGWGLTVAGTPYSANSLMHSRITGYDAQTAALRWNLTLSLCARYCLPACWEQGSPIGWQSTHERGSAALTGATPSSH